MTGDVLEILQPQPLVIQLRGLAGSPLSGTWTLKKGSWLDAEVLSYETKFGNARVESFDTVEPGSEYRVTLAADPVDRPMIYNEILNVKVKTSDGEERDLEFRFRVEHNARVVTNPKNHLKFLPNQMSGLLADPPRPVMRPITLTGGGPEVTFHVTGVDLDDKLKGVFRTEVATLAEGRNYQVRVYLDEWQEQKQVLGKMTIHTDDPDYSDITLWVMALFRAPDTKAGR